MNCIATAALASIMVALANCAWGAEEPLNIAVFTKNSTNPAYESFRVGADKVGGLLGARIRHFVPNKPDNVDEQKAMVEQVLQDKPDIVIFIPVDDVAMVESVRKLNDANIPVVVAGNALPGRRVTFIGADDVEIGYRQARYLFEKLGGKGKIVVIEGVPAAPTNRDRLRGYQRAFAEFPAIVVLGTGTGNYQQPDGKRAMAKFLREYAQIDAVLSANDSMALGALEALKDAGRTTTVIGINGILDAVRRIETGALLASVDFNMFKIGCVATRAAVRHLKGEPVPEKVMLPAEIIDRTNFKAWLTPVAERPCPEWNDVVR
jgi:ribose transport system substrate-binding protein